MRVHQICDWRHATPELRRQYRAECAAETLSLGRLLIILGPATLAYFIVQDSLVIGLPVFLKFRLIPAVALGLYAVFLFTRWARIPRLLLWAHSLLLFSVSCMMTGIGFIVFSDGFFNHWQRSASASGILAGLITVHLFSGIARPYFAIIAGAPLFFLVAALTIRGGFGFEDFSILSNALYAGIAISVVSVVQESMRFQDFLRKSQTLRQNRELEKIAGTDELTGLRNRRAGLAILSNLLETASHRNTPLTICFLDADGLKRVNDEFGHREGDYYLQTIARTIEKALSPGESCARMGGDEFILMFPGKTEKEAEKTVRTIHEELREMSQTNLFPLEVSHGFAEYDPTGAAEAKDLLRLADSRMYLCKQAKKRLTE